MTTIQVDLDEIAKARIKKLETENARLQRKVNKLEIELYDLKDKRKQVEAALHRIKRFASELPQWEMDW